MELGIKGISNDGWRGRKGLEVVTPGTDANTSILPQQEPHIVLRLSGVDTEPNQSNNGNGVSQADGPDAAAGDSTHHCRGESSGKGPRGGSGQSYSW